MTAALAPLDATPGRAGGPRAAPRITTRRLVLREMRLEDWPGYRDMMTSMRAVHMGGPFGLNVAWCAFCADLAGWGITGAGALTVEREGVVVGQVVLNDIPAFPELELGWMTYPGHEGQGIATEAAAAFLDWARSVVRPHGLVSYVSPENTASAAVARALGGRLDPTALRPAREDLVFRHVGEIVAGGPRGVVS